jgi:serine protease Do
MEPMRRSFAICLLIIAGALFGALELTAEEQLLRVVPLPINEVEAILEKWLVQGGFEVDWKELPMAVHRFSAAQPNQTWQIELKPQSALATEVNARFRSAETFREKLSIAALSDYLADYVKQAATGTIKSHSNIPDAISIHIQSVVCLDATEGQKSTQYTGFILDPGGLILCTTHGLKGSENVRVVLYDGRTLVGKPIKVDPKTDLALIQVSPRLESSIALQGGRNLLDIGEQVYSIGCPVNRIGTVYSGEVSGPPRRAESMPYWQVSMEIHPGSSGSPVFDARGNLVGLVKGRYRGTQTIGFLIPLETIIEFVKDTSPFAPERMRSDI